MQAVQDFYNNTNFKDIVNQKANEAYTYISNPTSEKVASALEIGGLAGVVAGTVNVANGHKARGVKNILTGALAAGSASVVRALNECYQKEANSFWGFFFGPSTKTLGVLDKMICSPKQFTDQVMDKAKEQTLNYAWGAGVATTVGGSVDFLNGNRKRGATVALMGAAATAATYFIKV